MKKTFEEWRQNSRWRRSNKLSNKNPRETKQKVAFESWKDAQIKCSGAHQTNNQKIKNNEDENIR